MAFRGGHSYNHLHAGQPYGPRRCGGPEHSAGYLSSLPNTHYDTHGCEQGFLQGACVTPQIKIMPGKAS